MTAADTPGLPGPARARDGGTLHLMADRTSSSIMVAADPAAVMRVIADFGSYPEWATGVRRAEIVEAGPDGRALRVRFALDAGVIKDSYVLAYEWDGDTAVSWQLAEAGSMVTEMSGAYQLAGDGGATKVSYELTVATRVPMLGLIRRRAERAIIDTALKGLKSRAESESAAGR
jgi:Polyketide cyclase / dehydrase and lipid transport